MADSDKPYSERKSPALSARKWTHVWHLVIDSVGNSEVAYFVSGARSRAS